MIIGAYIQVTDKAHTSRHTTLALLAVNTRRDDRTHALSCSVEILALQLREDLEELLEKANKLLGKIVLVLAVFHTQ